MEEEILGLVHTDICGPMDVSSLGRARYFATFIDDKTRFMEVVNLEEKSEIFTVFRKYKARVEKRTGKQIKKLRSDNAREYLSKEFSEYL